MLYRDTADNTNMKNQAFAFIKPHAMNSQATATHIEDVFEDENIRVSFSERKTGNELKKIIDRHFARISDFAFVKSISSLDLGLEGNELFLDAFGESWDDAAASGRVLNSSDAMKKLGNISPKMLCTEWARYGAVEIVPDCYVSHFDEYDRYVLNGFYPIRRESYTGDNAEVLVMLLDFEIDWMDFNENIVGNDNPVSAHEDSIRGYLYNHAAVLEMLIDSIDNIIHISSSPFEALCEKMIWLEKKLWLQDPLLTSASQLSGVKPDKIASWIFSHFKDPHMRNVLTGKNTDHVARILIDKFNKTSMS